MYDINFHLSSDIMEGLRTQPRQGGLAGMFMTFLF